MLPGYDLDPFEVISRFKSQCFLGSLIFEFEYKHYEIRSHLILTIAQYLFWTKIMIKLFLNLVISITLNSKFGNFGTGLYSELGILSRT